MVLISFIDLYKIHIFPKFHRCGSKIVPATPFWNSNFKWAWQAQFLSHIYETLEKYVFYIDLWVILVPFFEIHYGFWDKNFVHHCHIHILSHPWLMKVSDCYIAQILIILEFWIHIFWKTIQGFHYKRFKILPMSGIAFSAITICTYFPAEQCCFILSLTWFIWKGHDQVTTLGYCFM